MKQKILIIDDETDYANLLNRRLKLEGYEVNCYYWGEGAFDFSRRTLPDLILLDINLPDISGMEIYQQIKADATVKQIPIIIHSALHEKETHCLDFLKAEGFIKKPCNAVVIIQTIKQVLN